MLFSFPLPRLQGAIGKHLSLKPATHKFRNSRSLIVFTRDGDKIFVIDTKTRDDLSRRVKEFARIFIKRPHYGDVFHRV